MKLSTAFALLAALLVAATALAALAQDCWLETTFDNEGNMIICQVCEDEQGNIFRVCF
jgi:hypothetical protein